MGDYFCCICLITAVCVIMLHSLNKVGYEFTVIDGIVFELLGIAAFTVPMGITYFIASIFG